jgi:AraC-like DNA-binding protein
MAQVTILAETPMFLAGTFRCPPADDRWREENWIGRSHVLAFPRRAVIIERSRRRRVVANPNHVVLYNPDDTYRRGLLSPEGDDSLFIEIRQGAASALLADASRGAPLFARIESVVTDDVALRLHALELGIRSRPSGLDPLVVEEILAGVVAAVGAAPDDHPAGAGHAGTRRLAAEMGRRRLIDDTRALLSVAYAEPLTLADIGRRVGASPFHLARTFRAVTGQSIHRYRERLRLREALRRIRDGERDLARAAVDVGFASHSHLDDRFRRAFGMPPAAARGPALGGRASPSIGR